MELLDLLKIVPNDPKLAIIIAALGAVGLIFRKLVNTGFSLLAQHLENIDDNFKSIAKDLNGLRVDVAKVAERLEAREELVDTKIEELDRRITRIEDREDRVQ